jgi:hypothetical protein
MLCLGVLCTESREQTVFKNSVRSSKRTPHLTIKKINWLTLFKDITAVYSENDTKPVNIKYNATEY